MFYHNLSQWSRLFHRNLPLSLQSLSKIQGRQTPLCCLSVLCRLPSPGARGLSVRAGRWRLLWQSRTTQDRAQPWPSLPLRRGAARVSLPGLLPAVRSTVINRGNDLASCLCLVKSGRVFSFLTHWACKTKWVLVFRLVHLLDGNAERAPATCSWLFWKERQVGLVHPSHWVLCSEYRACMTLSLSLLAHLPFILEHFLRALLLV